MITFPEASEYNSYYQHYIELVKDEDVIKAMEDGIFDVNELMATLTEEQLTTAYAEGKWTIKELFQHIMDTERIFCYRALRFARNDMTELAGFEQDDYNQYAFANKRSSIDLLHEYNTIRDATIGLFKGFTDEMLLRTGTASNSPMSVRAIAHILVGHERHHLNVINERYLNL